MIQSCLRVLHWSPLQTLSLNPMMSLSVLVHSNFTMLRLLSAAEEFTVVAALELDCLESFLASEYPPDKPWRDLHPGP